MALVMVGTFSSRVVLALANSVLSTVVVLVLYVLAIKKFATDLSASTLILGAAC